MYCTVLYCSVLYSSVLYCKNMYVVPELVLPLEVWLHDLDAADEREVGVQPDPQHRAVVHLRQVHVNLKQINFSTSMLKLLLSLLN